MGTFPHRKPPRPRHTERRSGRATVRFQEALDGPVNTDTPLPPEAYERAKASREKHARRRPESKVEDETEEVLVAVGAVVALLVVIFLMGIALAS